MILLNWTDHFPISVHPQQVCDSSHWSCQVDLTIFQPLSTISLYVMIVNDPVKLTWPFPNLCPSSASMWWLSMTSWPDHFPIPVHPQQVCDGSQWSCQVDLTISQSLSILRMYVMVLNDPVKLTWPFPNLCLSLECMWWFQMILLSSRTWWFPNLCPSSACMWWF